MNEQRNSQFISQKKFVKTHHYLTPQELEHFKARLLSLREEHRPGTEDHRHRFQEEPLNDSDPIDRASLETDRSLEVHVRDHKQRLIFKIDQALIRIEKGTYGYCEETGEPIGLSRLEAYPLATLSLEAQEFYERLKRTASHKSLL
jgi:DnaK suppressor protein